MTRGRATMSAKVPFQAPRSVLVVLAFDGSVRSVVEDDGCPFHYDLEDNECFVRYLVDEGAEPIARRLAPMGTSVRSGREEG